MKRKTIINEHLLSNVARDFRNKPTNIEIPEFAISVFYMPYRDAQNMPE